MFLADTHTHSNCSPDGSHTMAEMAQGALQAGLDCLCITDHFDTLSLDGTERIYHYDWAPVRKQLDKARRTFGNRLDLRLGLEMGMGHIAPETVETILTQPELDFVIGSVHNLSEELGGKDFYFADYGTQENCYRALDNYFASMELLSQSACYDVLGHIIYPLRYMTGPYEPPTLDRYTDQLRRILTFAADSGRGMEVNTWRGRTIEAWIPVLRLFQACGGEIVTVGSDAHDPSAVGFGVRASYDMLRDLGFRYVAVYRKRKPDMMKL